MYFHSVKTFLTLLLLLGFSWCIHARTFAEKRRDVYLHPHSYTEDTIVYNFEDAYFKGLANYLIGKLQVAEGMMLKAKQWEGERGIDMQREYHLLMCRIYRGKNQFIFAMEELSMALNIATKQGNKAYLGEVYVEYMEQLRASKQFVEAESYIPLIADIEDDLSDEDKIRYWHRTAAVIVESRQDYSNAAVYLAKSIRWADSLDYPWQSGYANLDMGYVEFQTVEVNTYEYFRRAYRIFDELGHTIDRSTALFNLARYYHKHKMYDSANTCLVKLYGPALENNWVSILGDYWDIRTKVYLDLKNYDSALFSAGRYHDYKMMEFVNYNGAEIAEMNAKIGAVSARNALLESENQRFQTSQRLFEESRTKKIYGVLLVLLGLLSGGIIYLFYQQKQNVKKLILQGEEIEKANLELKNTLDQKDLIYMELHHRVKNNLANLSGLLYLQEKNISSKEAKDALAETRFRIQAMSHIHHGMYKSDDLIVVNMQSNLEALMPNLLSIYEDRVSNVVPNINCEKLEIEVDTAVHLSMIINELLTNSLKYAFNGRSSGLLTIEGKTSKKGGWRIRVIDDGPGLPEDFDWDNTKSLGLYLVKVLSEEIDANFKYERENNLSIFTISHHYKNS